ncbi:branched-chain-amino-acid transaminase [Ranunculus cassubicifolius]
MEPATSSKALLSLEKNNNSSLESTLLICKKESTLNSSKPSGNLVTNSVPKSQVLGKLKDFLGVIAEANTRLQHDATEKSSADYDIEVLTGNESEYIEMDLLLGVADLQTPEAVAAAESVMAGSLSAAALDAANFCTESSSDDDDDDDDDEDSDDKACSSEICNNTISNNDISLNNGRMKKRQKIIEL